MFVKKFYSTLILVFMVCAIILTGCKGATLSFPETNTAVIGNGGIAVIKDDYLYYVNGYVDASLFSDIRKDNIYGNEVRGAIFKTRLLNNKIQKDEDGFLKETQVVVPQVVGFNNGGFYIIGDYLYYLTPLMEEDGATTLLKTGFLEVCRIKLDGTGKERVYKTNNAIENVTWSVYNMDGKDVVVMLDGKNLVSITVSGKDKNTVTMATDVTTVSLLQQSNYIHGQDSLKPYEQYVYYTRDITESDNRPTAKNALCSVKIGSNTRTVLEYGDNEEYKIETLNNGKLYYSKTIYIGSTAGHPELFMRDTKTTIKTEVQVSKSGYTNIAVLNGEENTNSDGLKVVTVDSSNVIRRVQANGSVSEVIYRATSSISIVGIKNTYLYIQQNGHIYRLDIYGEATQELIQLTNNDITYYASKNSLIDIDGSRLFIFAKYNGDNGISNYYLNVVETINKIEVADGDMISKFVGKFKSGECPPKPEEIEEEENEDGTIPEKEPWII